LKNGQKLKLGDAHVTPKKYPSGTSIKAWGCPRGTPFFIGKNQFTFQNTIFLLVHALCFFLVRQWFLLSVFLLFCLLQ
jgi:hypothetical protein